MRVLHVIDPGSPGGGACTLQRLSEALAGVDGVEHDVLLIGTARHEALARRCGVKPAGRIAPPRNEPLLAGFRGRSFRSLLLKWEKRKGRYDLIHTWTVGSTLLAAVAAPRRRRIATLTVAAFNVALARLLSARLRRHPARILVNTGAARGELIGLGFDEHRIDMIRPAVNPDLIEESNDARTALRDRWGINADDDDAFVVALLADPPGWCDARAAASIMALLQKSGRDVRMVVYPDAARRVEARKWAGKLGLDHCLITEDELAEPWRCLHAIDGAFFLTGDMNTPNPRDAGSLSSLIRGGGQVPRPIPGVMPALWAMAAGVPVAAERAPAMEEIIEDRETGLLFDPQSVSAAAHALVGIYDERDFARRLASAARARVQRNHSASDYAARLKEAYERLVDGDSPVEMTAP